MAGFYPTITIFTSGTTLPADSTYRIFRVSYPFTTGADVTKTQLTCGYLNGGTNNNTTYLDWITFGYDLNFADLGPSNRGAMLSEKMGITKTYERTLNQADSGALEATQVNTGLNDVHIKSTPIDELAYTNYRNFFEIGRAHV